MLIALCTYSTPENKKHDYAAQTIDCVHHTVNLKAHRVVIVDNGSTDERTPKLLDDVASWATVIRNGQNLGTARAINKAWKLRLPGQHACKMDDDVLVHQMDWPDLMEEVFRREPTIGICALKRNDLGECPWHNNPDYRTKLHMLPHTPGQRWIVVEQANMTIGTCQGYSSALLDKIGGLWQIGPYGLDDSFAGVRCRVAGFANVFLPSVPIDHIDPGGTLYQKWKEEVAREPVNQFAAIAEEFLSGKRPIFWQDPE